MDLVNKKFNELDKSIKQRIGQEEKYIHDIQSGLVKIIRDLHSCHDSILDQLRDGTLTYEKRDELAQLIAETDERLARFADAESIQLANTRPPNRLNPLRPDFWRTPRPVPVGVPVTTYRAEHDPEINDHFSDNTKSSPDMVEDYFSDKNKPHPGIADSHIINKGDKEEFAFGGTRRRRRRRTRR